MSDSPSNTPTKPKPGSLRDRIAAFENKAAASASPERPPPPRPKPAAFATWKPRPPSPLESSTTSTTSVDVGNISAGISPGGGEGVARGSHSGMNAADAKESITRTGGSLKERMAALQGRGGFGAPAPPPAAPRPAAENRPKWKPPPQVVAQPDVSEEGEIKDQSKVDSDEKEQSEIVVLNPPSIKSPLPIARSPPSTLDDEATGIAEEAEGLQESVDATADAGAEVEQTQVDEEEEQRQRRAAIAARMAKLGGARIGMGPPIFGRPAVPPPSKKPSLPVSVPEAEAEPLKVMEESIETPPDSSPRQPASMPAPTIPKRAAPPRRKPAKQTSTGAAISPEASPIPPPGEVPAALSLTEESAAPSVPASDVIEHRTEENFVEEPKSIDENDTGAQPELVAQTDKVIKEVGVMPEEADQEDDEQTRKKRVAEKLAKMGGINPFALPPLRKPSAGSVASAEGVVTSPPTSPPVPGRKPSLGSPRPVPADKPAIMKRASGSSVGSVDAPLIGGAGVTRRTSLGSVMSVGSTGETRDTGVGRRASVGSVRSARKVEEVNEVQEITEEPEEIIFEGGNSTLVPHVREGIEAKEENDEIEEQDAQEERPHDEGSRLHSYDDEDNTELDFDATPQPPPRIPQIASSVRRGQGAQTDPRIIASVVSPLPSGSPSTTAVDHTETLSAPTVLPPPTTAPTSRDHSADRDRLSGPAPPRRVVPQTPEPLTPEQRIQNLDNEHNQPGIDIETKESDDEDESELAQSTLFVPPPASVGTAYRTVLSAEIDEGEENESPLHVLPPSGIEGKKSTYDNIDAEPNMSGIPLPVRVNFSSGGDLNQVKTKPSRTVPPPPPPVHSIPPASSVIAEDSGSEYSEDRDDEHGPQQDQTDESEEQVLRTRPLSDEHSQSLSISSSAADLAENIPLIVPPRLAEGGGVRHAPIRSVPPPPGPQGPSSPVPEEEEKEVLDEDEGDPIDPSFHSPSQRGSLVPGDEFEQTITQIQGQRKGSLTPSLSPSSAVRSPTSSELKEKHVEEFNTEETEAEMERKQTIAERMARLGGIKFGAGPGIVGRPPVPMRKKTSGASEDVETQGDQQGDQQEKYTNAPQESGEVEDEEEERARRDRIAAKLAGMGGMRIGMMPMAVPPRQSHVLQDVPPKVPAAVPPRVLQSTTRGSDASESGASEDGVKVEAEESEIEEVGYEEAKGGSEEGSGEEVPPPPPVRPSNRRDTTSTTSAKSPTVLSPTSPTVSVYRTPAPVPGPFRRTSTQSVSSSMKAQQSIQAQPAEYVLVDDPQVIGEETESEVITKADAVPPPPPTRSVHRAPPPGRGVPPTPPASLGDSISSQWELPTIPTSSFDGDLSASWSEAMLDDRQAQPPQSAHVVAPPPAVIAPPPPRSPEALHLDPDDLMAMWGRVGVQICEASTRLYDHAKKNLVGDGTFRGFVDAVLHEVPNASKPQSKQIPYGYLVYLQNGAQVQKRASEIMPGDVAEIVDARFKGHKGLGGYQQHVGAGVEGGEGGGPVVGIVCEFEMKRSKLKLFQANQNVGKHSVEVGTYRLEDLKSGLVKVYRVLET